jgi:hypothetical protein
MVRNDEHEDLEEDNEDKVDRDEYERRHVGGNRWREISIVMKTKKRPIGHILYGFVASILKGKIMGKRPWRGRRGQSYLKDELVDEWVSLHSDT